MLSRYVIERFRNRKLESFRYLKKLTRKQLLKMVNDLDPVPDFISPKPMWNHQLVSFLACVYVGHFLLFLDMGLGKSRVILEVIAYLKKKGDLKSALIVVPNSTTIESWSMQIEEHRPDLKHVPMYGKTSERLTLLNREADVFIINYDGLNYLCSSMVGGQDIKKRLRVNPKSLKLVSDKFNFICADETTALMNHQSLRYQVCRKLSMSYPYRFGMAGIPFGRDPQALWSQFNFCDHGETLGETLTLFREAFFLKKENYWSGGYDYTFNKKHTKLLNRTLQNRSIHYDEGECRDMPKKVYKPIYVPFTEDMKAYYNSIVLKVKENNKDIRVVQNSFLHMRQIASGFIGLIDDSTGERAQIEFKENPKLEAMVQAISEIPEDRKFLVFHEFTWTGNRISQELTKLKIPHGRLYGGQKDSPKVLRQFTQTDDLRALVINNKCGAFSLNLQVANYIIYFESPVSPIVRGQSEKRIHRGTQKKKCFYLDLIMNKNTADESIQEFLREGKNLEEALMKGNAKLRLEKV